MEAQGTNRRSLLAGSLLAGGGAIVGTRYVFAQEATPDANNETTPTGSTPEAGQPGAAEDIATFLTDRLATVQADLDAVRDQLDATTIDAILTQATDLIGQTGTGDGTALSAAGLIESAAVLIRAQLLYPGLPSEEAGASHLLANVYDTIDLAGNDSTTDAFALSTAETLYSSAYDLYGASAWAQAAATARGAALLFGGRGERSGPGGRGGEVFGGGGGMIGGMRGGGKVFGGEFGTDEMPADDSQTPVEVPAPEFESQAT